MPNQEILENLKKAIAEYDTDGAVSWARKVLEEKISPVEATDEILEEARSFYRQKGLM